jgi:ABC-2 type transport system permease protein
MYGIRSGEQTITATVARRPTRAGIDPNHLLIDLQTDDTQTIQVQS